MSNFDSSGTRVSRLFPSLFALPLVAPFLILFGFTIRVHLAFPLVWSFCFGFMISINFSPTSSYLMELYPTQAAAVSGLPPLVQFSLSAVGSAVAPIATQNIGEGYLFLILGLAVIVFSVPLIVMYVRQRNEKDVAVSSPATEGLQASGEASMGSENSDAAVTSGFEAPSVELKERNSDVEPKAVESV